MFINSNNARTEIGILNSKLILKMSTNTYVKEIVQKTVQKGVPYKASINKNYQMNWDYLKKDFSFKK